MVGDSSRCHSWRFLLGLREKICLILTSSSTIFLLGDNSHSRRNSVREIWWEIYARLGNFINGDLHSYHSRNNSLGYINIFTTKISFTIV